MPQPQKYNSHAERQAAYRRRRQDELTQHLDRKGLPHLPVGKTRVAGHARWQAAMSMVEAQMIRVEAEMEAYFEDRSERWQQAEKGEDFEQKLTDLRAALELVTEWIA
jgi:hypothetical protein